MFKAEYLFARILLPLVIGIGVAYFFQSKLAFHLCSTAGLISLFVLVGLNFYYTPYGLNRHKGLIGTIFIFLFFLLGASLCLYNSQRIQPNYFGNERYRTLKIWVAEEPQETNNIVRFKSVVTAGHQQGGFKAASGNLLIALKLDTIRPLQLRYGDELIISCAALPVEPPYNPAEFDFKAWLASQNVYLQAFVLQQQAIKTHKIKGNPLLQLALKVRKDQINKYRKLIKGDEAFAIASTLILGYRADLSSETLDTYAKTGTIHALSVSGAHVAIIYAVINFLFSFMRKGQKSGLLKLVLISVLIWTYAIITGLSPSVTRSAIMITAFIVSKTFAKDSNSYNILAFSAFVQLVYDPFLLWDVGFQLSYLAVFGLLYLQPKIYHWFFIRHKWLDKIWQFIALSLAAQIVSFPLSLYYFHQFPVYFLLANLIITLPLVAMMYLGIIILIPGMGFFAPILTWIITHTNNVLQGIADLPFSTVSSVWISFTEFLLLSLSLSFIIYGLVHLNKMWIYASLICFIFYQVSIVNSNLKAVNQHRIIFFSLRKNYAASFIKGRTAFLLTDLKMADKNYLFFIKPALDQAQITDVHLLALDREIISKDIILKNQQLVFHGYKILLIDQCLNNRKIDLEGDFSAIWLHQNTRFNLDKLPVNLKYKTILIDATNSDYRIKQFKTFAENNHLDTHILKKNKAYLVELTP